MSWRRLGGRSLLAAAVAVGGMATTTSFAYKSSMDVVDAAAVIPQMSREERLRSSIERALTHCDDVQRHLGLPGLSVAVAIDGNIVFRQGMGYADVENKIPMRSDTVLRIASISKSITMAMLAKQMEDGKVDIDLPVQTYLPDFPKKKWEGSNVTVTVRHLLSHLSGIRHYRKKEDVEKKKEATSDSDYKEFFCQEGCESVAKALEIFQNDELMHKPGTTYYYTTHGWTVVSAVIEKITETPFDKHAKRMFQFWGLQNTYVDEHNPIITNRGRYYRRDKESKLINAPWVDNSCKWAGGGFLSTVEDLVKFSHIMLYSAQQPLNSNGDKINKAFLKRETIQKLWTGDKATAAPFADNLYGLGWVVGDPFSNCVGCNSREEKVVSHSGGAVGASSILLIQFPPKSDSSSSSSEKKTATSNSECVSDQQQEMNDGKVKGVVVAMITNLQDASLTPTAKKLIQEFAWMMDP